MNGTGAYFRRAGRRALAAGLGLAAGFFAAFPGLAGFPALAALAAGLVAPRAPGDAVGATLTGLAEAAEAS
jgi:hypothetical protein